MMKGVSTAPGPPKRKTKKNENRFRQKLVRKKKQIGRPKLGVKKTTTKGPGNIRQTLIFQLGLVMRAET